MLCSGLVNLGKGQGAAGCAPWRCTVIAELVLNLLYFYCLKLLLPTSAFPAACLDHYATHFFFLTDKEVKCSYF